MEEIKETCEMEEIEEKTIKDEKKPKRNDDNKTYSKKLKESVMFNERSDYDLTKYDNL